MEYYQHKPLSDISTEIRLVNLQPGHESDPIHVTLTHVFLNGNVTYDALSYAWGDPDVTLPISIGGLPFQVTVNLESALRHLRLESQLRIIWIDAICIHQSNIEERDQQLRRMASIYANAKHVLVWLGAAADDSGLAMELIDEDRWDKIVDQELLEDPQPPTGGDLESTRHLKAIIKLFSRPWWLRGWIIQEVTEGGRSRDNVLLHCGHSQKRWEVIASAMESLGGLEWVDRRVEIRGSCKINTQFWSHLAYVVGSSEGLAPDTVLDFESWLDILRKFKTTEPKDKFWIACLLSQHDETFSGLNPQYRWSWRETYIFIVRYVLNSLRSLKLLEYCSTLSDLPSWVPDWRVPGAIPLSGWAGMASDRFRACGTSELIFEISKDAYLHLKGFLFARAERFPPFQTNTLSTDLRRESAVIGPTYKATGENSLKSLIRVTYADLEKGIQEALEWQLASEEERQSLSTPTAYKPGLDGEIDIFQSGFYKASVAISGFALYSRKYFVSTNDYIGLVPEAAREGDMICIFVGGNTPFLVRPVGDNYQLVGACYVHGIMYGEAMEEFEKEGREMQDFVLV